MNKEFRFPGRRLRSSAPRRLLLAGANRKHVSIIATGLLALFLSACAPEPSGSDKELAKLRQDMQKKTERIYWIHLRLDTAITEISKAEAAAVDGNTSAAEFHAGEAYRSVQQADEALLELGTQLQEVSGLDRK